MCSTSRDRLRDTTVQMGLNRLCQQPRLAQDHSRFLCRQTLPQKLLWLTPQLAATPSTGLLLGCRQVLPKELAVANISASSQQQQSQDPGPSCRQLRPKGLPWLTSGPAVQSWHSLPSCC